MVKFSKFCSESFYHLTDQLTIKNNKISAASQSVATVRIAPKICHAQPNNVLTMLQISSKSVHFRRSYSRMREHRFCPIEYFHDSPEAMLRFGGIIT